MWAAISSGCKPDSVGAGTPERRYLDETFKLHQAVVLPENRLKAALPAFLPERVKFILYPDY
jgi:hypothetical protein